MASGVELVTQDTLFAAEAAIPEGSCMTRDAPRTAPPGARGGGAWEVEAEGLGGRLWCCCAPLAPAPVVALLASVPRSAPPRDQRRAAKGLVARVASASILVAVLGAWGYRDTSGLADALGFAERDPARLWVGALAEGWRYDRSRLKLWGWGLFAMGFPTQVLTWTYSYRILSRSAEEGERMVALRTAVTILGSLFHVTAMTIFPPLASRMFAIVPSVAIYVAFFYVRSLTLPLSHARRAMFILIMSVGVVDIATTVSLASAMLSVATDRALADLSASELWYFLAGLVTLGCALFDFGLTLLFRHNFPARARTPRFHMLLAATEIPVAIISFLQATVWRNITVREPAVSVVLHSRDTSISSFWWGILSLLATLLMSAVSILDARYGLSDALPTQLRTVTARFSKLPSKLISIGSSRSLLRSTSSTNIPTGPPQNAEDTTMMTNPLGATTSLQSQVTPKRWMLKPEGSPSASADTDTRIGIAMESATDTGDQHCSGQDGS